MIVKSFMAILLTRSVERKGTEVRRQGSGDGGYVKRTKQFL